MELRVRFQTAEDERRDDPTLKTLPIRPALPVHTAKSILMQPSRRNSNKMSSFKGKKTKKPREHCTYNHQTTSKLLSAKSYDVLANVISKSLNVFEYYVTERTKIMMTASRGGSRR